MDINTRIEELKREYQKGRDQLLELDQAVADIGKKKVEVKNTLLRVSGAIQALSEFADEAVGDSFSRAAELSQES